MIRGIGLLVAVIIAAVVVAPAPAEETQTTTSTPVLGTSSATFGARSAGSLAEVARKLRLAKPEGRGVMEVNDANLGEIAASGSISVAEGAASTSQPAVATGAKPAETQAEDWEKRYGEQAEAVAKAEEWLAAVDDLSSQPQDPYLPNRGPYNSPPGTVSEGQQQRDEAARAVAEERAKLDALRQEGRRLGAGR